LFKVVIESFCIAAANGLSVLLLQTFCFIFMLNFLNTVYTGLLMMV